MRAQVVQAHAAGVATAFGTLAQPVVPEPAAATAISTYFHQVLQYGISQKMALASMGANRTPSAPVTSRVVNIRDPDLFKGTDRSKLEVYKSQVRNKLRGNAAEFLDESSQVSYAVFYLSGAAYAWAAPQTDEQGQWQWANIIAFFASLDTAFNDPDQARTVEWEIDRLKQGKDLCSIYYAKFTTLAAKLPEWNDSIKKSKFYTGLHDDVKEALIGQVTGTETFDAYTQKCVFLDRQLEQRRLEKGGKKGGSSMSYPAHAVPSTQSGTHAGPMDLSSGTRKKLTEEQKQYRRANNLCLYCSKSGHFASACRARPNSGSGGSGSGSSSSGARPQKLAEAVTSVVIAETDTKK